MKLDDYGKNSAEKLAQLFITVHDLFISVVSKVRLKAIKSKRLLTHLFFYFFLKWCVSLRTENTLLFINVWLSLFSQMFFLITHCRLSRVFWTDISFTVMSLGNIWCYCCTHLQTQFPALAVKETVAKSPASPHTRDIVSRAGYRSNGS